VKNFLSAIIRFLSILAAGVVLMFAGCGGGQPVEIILPQTTTSLPAAQVYIGGQVNNPGLYPLQPGDSLESLILAAGGYSGAAGIDDVEIYIAPPGGDDSPQKIDINRAQAWLLDALPGIGGVTAQAIVDYRQQNGPFRSIDDLLRVKGIGEETLQNIAGYVTVAGRG
jgi:competence protein ComEA